MSLFDDLIKPSPFSTHGQQNMSESDLYEYNRRRWEEYWQRCGRETVEIANQLYTGERTIAIKPKKWWQWWR